MTTQRTPNLPRLSGFEKPDRMRGSYYLYYRYFFADLRAALERYIRRGDRVFDIGCGNKPYEQHIRTLTQRSEPDAYRGCDIVQSSEQRADILCPATSIPEPDGAYDVVICTQVIEHVFSHAQVFSEAFRLLRSGGYFIVSSNLVWELHETPYDFYRFTRYGFEELLRTAGFTIIEGKANGGRYSALGQMFLHVTLSVRCATLFGCIVRGVWRRSIILLCNLIVPCLDRLDRSHPQYENYTLNYTFVGQKP